MIDPADAHGQADPFVIALAAEWDWTVVTAERSKPTKPKIPDACRELGIPCITLRENTERPITVEMGTNTIAGTDTSKIIAAANRALNNPLPESNVRIPEFWDGRAADRILDALIEVT